MLIPAAKLIHLERAGALRWLIPFGATLANGRQPASGAVFEIASPTGAVFTCRLETAAAEQITMAYVGPERPEPVMRLLGALLV